MAAAADLYRRPLRHLPGLLFAPRGAVTSRRRLVTSVIMTSLLADAQNGTE